MTIEGLGKKFKEARLARNLTLDEAARMTKIRPSRLAEIEADDFSNFPSLAYAKGFLLIYGKFLHVDVSSYLEAFETSNAVTVDGYSYLQDTPAPKAPAPVIRTTRSRSSLMPLLVGIFILVVGLSLVKLILNISRISSSPNYKQVGIPMTPMPSAAPAKLIAPRAQPAPSAPVNRVVAAVNVVPSPTGTPLAQSTPAPTLTPTPTEPEVRRAIPVRPEDLVAAGLKPAPATTPQPAQQLNEVEIRPLRRTYVRVVTSNDGHQRAVERWISPGDGAIRVEGQHVSVRVLERDAVLIRKNGHPLAAGDNDVTVE